VHDVHLHAASGARGLRATVRPSRLAPMLHDGGRDGGGGGDCVDCIDGAVSNCV
jgi:hypothetical protein